MNRCYRLVWNHVLQATQVASEIASSASTAPGSRARRGARRLLRVWPTRQAAQLAFTLTLTSLASAAWAATCPAGDTTGCSAPGGSGVPGRSGDGGAGNGQGGGSSHLDGSGVTIQDPGAPAGTNGNGGSGAAGDSGAGGSGGQAYLYTGGSSVSVIGSFAGAIGDTGADGVNFGSGGGGGGAGLYFIGGSVSVATATNVIGAVGGAGGNTANGITGNAGAGGGGGAALITTGNATTVTVNGSLQGGDGGAGGTGGFGGGGGGGGDGLLTLGASTIITNTGSITGGAGGAGGLGGSGSGGGGAGGAGVNLTGGNNVLANIGTIVGGAANGAPAGAGIVTNGLDTITNAGTITGGIANGTRAAAIRFGGTGNVLNLLAGSTILGDLVVDAGASATITPQSAGQSLGNGIVLTDAASAVTFNTSAAGLTATGTISGLGSVTTTSGTLVSSATHTYTGTTTIASGTLALTGSGSIAASSGLVNNGRFDISTTTSGTSVNSLTGSGMVVLGTRTLAVNNAAGTFSGAIGGTGGFTVAGGTQTLTGANTYTGATTIGSGATLALAGSGGIGASNGVTNNGTLDISGTTGGASITSLAGAGSIALGTRTLTLTNATGTTYAGSISGSGGLTLNAGTQVLAGANTYTGDTTINGGTLTVTGSLSSASNIALAASGATLDMSGAGAQTVRALSGGAGSRVQLGANTMTVISPDDSTFDGALAGTGVLAKQGAGMLTLNGNSSGFTGTTRVDSGRLAVGDASHDTALLGGSVTVDTQGILSGHGTIAGNVLNQGIVMPGGSVGTLTVGGNYSQASNGTLTIEVNPVVGSQLRVGGSATLGGGLSIVYAPGTYTARRYTLLTAANGVRGTFSSVTSSTSAGADLNTLRPSLSYGTNDVALQLLAPDAASPVVVAPTHTSIYTALGTAALMRAQSANAAVLGRFVPSPDGQAGTRGAWVEATGSGTRLHAEGGQPGFKTRQYGFLAGTDRRVGEYTVGVAGGYTHTSIDEDATGSSGTTDTVRVALYGGRDFGPVTASATVGYGLNFLSQKRPFGTLGTAEDDHLGHELTAAGQAALPMYLGSFTVTPAAGLRYAFFRGQSFGESGAAAQNLAVDADTARSLQPYVSVKLDKAFGDAARPVNVQLRVGYARELMGAGRHVTVLSQDGTLFAAPGVALPRDYLTGGASVSFRPTKATVVSVGYDALINTAHASAQAGYARFDYRF